MNKRVHKFLSYLLMLAIIGLPLQLVHAGVMQHTGSTMKMSECQHMQATDKQQQKKTCCDQQQHQCNNCDNCMHGVNASVLPSYLLTLHLISKPSHHQLSATSLYGILPTHLLRPPRS